MAQGHFSFPFKSKSATTRYDQTRRSIATTKTNNEETTTKAAALPAINPNDGELQPAQIKTWNPFMGTTTGEQLEMDETA